MRIRMLTGLAGPHVAYSPGQEIDVHTNEAMRFIQAGIAEPIVDAPVRQWELRITPAEYVQRFPTGPNIALALELCE